MDLEKFGFGTKARKKLAQHCRSSALASNTTQILVPQMAKHISTSITRDNSCPELQKIENLSRKKRHLLEDKFNGSVVWSATIVLAPFLLEEIVVRVLLKITRFFYTR